MIYNYITSEAIIAKVYRDFKPGIDGWVGDAIEWIAEVLERTNCPVNMEEVQKCVTITEYRGKTPCTMESLDVITYNGCVLPRKGNTNFSDKSANDKQGTYSHFYRIEGPWIKTSFEEGEIQVHYKRIPIAENGFPLVPDSGRYKEAMTHYILMKLIGRGYKHPSLPSYLNMMDIVEDMLEKARIDALMPDKDEMEKFKRLWNTHNKDSNLNRVFFNSIGVEENLNFARPGTKYQSPYSVNKE